MATWKKLLTSGSNISELFNDAGYLTSATIPATVNSFATMSVNGTNVIADSGADTLTIASSSGQGLTLSGDSGTDTITLGLSSIPNSSLANSSVTIGSTNIALGTTSTTLAGLTSVTATSFIGTATTASNITTAITIGGGTSDRLLTTNADGTVTAETGLTFDGTTLTVAGNLTVNGTTTTVNTTNLIVSDQFILLGSGSLSKKDGGIVIQSDAADNTGYALAINATGEPAPRWGVTSSYDAGTTIYTPDEYVVTARSGSGNPTAAPTYGGTTFGHGQMYINGAGDIWIYA